MTTPLYKEALIESQKLRQLAMEEAKQAVLDSITPHIKSILEKEISGASVNLFEEEELPPPAPSSQEMDPMAGLDAAPPTPSTDVATLPPTETVTTPAPEANALPSVDAAPIESPSMGGMPLPGPDGTITIDLNAMFNSTIGANPVAGAEKPPIATQTAEAIPSPVVPEPTSDPMSPSSDAIPQIDGGSAPPQEQENAPPPPTEDSELNPLREEISRVERNIIKTIKNGKLTNYTKSIYENQLFNLFETVQVLKSNKKNNLKVDESRLNYIYGKLQKDNNSYQGQIKENKEMATKSLKAFTAALFEDASAGFGDSSESPSKDVVNSMNGAAGEKASKKAMSASKSTPVEDPGKDQSLTVSESEEMEMLEAELREMLGEEEDEEMMEEKADEEAELKEELRALKLKEAKVLRKLKECGMGGGTPVINIEIQTGEGGAEVNASGMGAEEPEMDMGAEEDMADDSVDFGGPDGEVELVDDSEEEEGSDDMESELDNADEETEEEEETADVEESPSMVAENKNLKKQLSETQMLMARSLYVNKLFARDNLSGTQKRKIVEYLDGARTIQEAKEVYGRIKKVLDESASKTTISEGKKKTVGSSSSATRKASINESVDNSGLINWTADTNRWQTLAGIKK